MDEKIYILKLTILIKMVLEMSELLKKINVRVVYKIKQNFKSN